MNRLSLNRLSVLFLCLPFGLLLAAFDAPLAIERARGDFPHDAYVWQRHWSPDVRDAVKQRGPAFSRLVVLGAEVSYARGRRSVARVPFELPPGAGIALRVGPTRRSLVLETPALVAIAKELACAGPSELQIDFDCPSRRLDEYRGLVTRLRAAVAPVPLVITALPSWLAHRAFRRLAHAADGFVLQVHSVAAPRPGEPFRICDPVAARRFVERAARIKRPFRVALPTYGYLAGFDANGRLLGLQAEGPGRDWPPGTRVRRIESDPAAMSALVASWRADRPAALRGVIWYRLPVDRERHNWKWPTLLAVLRGERPAPRLAAQATREDDGLWQVTLVNGGDADAHTYVEVELRWGAGALIAADAFGGFELIEQGAGRAVLRAQERHVFERVGPGERRALGWLRLRGAETMEVSLAPLAQ